MNPFLTCAIAALIPLVVGSLWYSPLLFLKPWLAATGLTHEAGRADMVRNMVILYIFSFFLAGGLIPIVIHQVGFYSMMGGPPGEMVWNNPDTQLHKLVVGLYGMHGHSFRTFRHGALHGAIAAVTLALPLIASNAAYEKRSVKYVLITFGFWLVNFTLMGAVVCHFAATRFDVLLK